MAKFNNMNSLKSIWLSVFSISGIEAISNIPTADIETIIKLIIQLGVGIATIINLLHHKKQK